jgi:hypothetical protein
MTMGVAEYLYIDKRRLNSYIEQFRSPVTRDKSLLWQAGISVSGPGASIGQASNTRSLTDHEKIELLLEHLQKTDQLGEGRNLDYHCETAFRLEQCCAQRAFIPPRPHASVPSKGIVLWISYGDSVAGLGTLTLLEDFPRSDNPEVVTLSAYSSLLVLFDEVDREVHSTVLHTRRRWTLKSRDRYNSDPIAFLKKTGCTIGPPRWIRALYRVRVAFLEVFSPGYGLPGSFGYPVFITEADSPYRRRTPDYYRDTIGEVIVKFQRRVSSTYTPASESVSEWLEGIEELEEELAELEQELREHGIDPQEILDRYKERYDRTERRGNSDS